MADPLSEEGMREVAHGLTPICTWEVFPLTGQHNARCNTILTALRRTALVAMERAEGIARNVTATWGPASAQSGEEISEALARERHKLEGGKP